MFNPHYQQTFYTTYFTFISTAMRKCLNFSLLRKALFSALENILNWKFFDYNQFFGWRFKFVPQKKSENWNKIRFFITIVAIIKYQKFYQTFFSKLPRTRVLSFFPSVEVMKKINKKIGFLEHQVISLLKPKTLKRKKLLIFLNFEKLERHPNWCLFKTSTGFCLSRFCFVYLFCSQSTAESFLKKNLGEVIYFRFLSWTVIAKKCKT